MYANKGRYEYYSVVKTLAASELTDVSGPQCTDDSTAIMMDKGDNCGDR